jgi:hypothetical protein
LNKFFIKKILIPSIGIFFFLLLNAILSIKSYGQDKLNIGIGTDFCYPRLNLDSKSSYQLNPDFGFQIGLGFEKKIKKLTSLQIELNFLTTKYQLKGQDSLIGLFKTYKSNFLQLPISFKYKISKSNFIIEVGVYLSYWLQKQIIGNTPDIFSANTSVNNTETFDIVNYKQNLSFYSALDNRLEFGYKLGISKNIRLYEDQELNLGLAILNSFTNAQKNNLQNNNSFLNRYALFKIEYGFYLK